MMRSVSAFDSFSSQANLLIRVFNTTDSAANSSDCFPVKFPSPRCNFRSAWAACLEQEASASSAPTACTIALPVHSSISMDTGNLCSLVLNASSSIAVEGNNATVAPAYSGYSRLFYYHNNNSRGKTSRNNAALSLRNVTLQGFGNWQDSSTDGGAIHIHGNCSVSLTNVTIADGGGRNGAAIYMTNNSIGFTVDGCTFVNCQAFNGGVFYSNIVASRTGAIH